MTDFGGKTSIFSHPVYLFLRKFSLQDSRGGSNSHTLIDANLPFGGMKQSGTGRDFGPDWLDGWCETKSVCVRY
ncbi:aldehyde dehydrogenase family protein [Escherichia coli]|nr:aldehyde dehydrogenase family protein [Escherichia coli]